MQIGTLDAAPLFLAPMAGVTDWAYRTVCRELSGCVTITEMVSSRALAELYRKNQRPEK